MATEQRAYDRFFSALALPEVGKHLVACLAHTNSADEKIEVWAFPSEGVFYDSAGEASRVAEEISHKAGEGKVQGYVFDHAGNTIYPRQTVQFPLLI